MRGRYYDWNDRREIAERCKRFCDQPTQQELRDVFRSTREDADNTFISLSGIDGNGDAVFSTFQPVTRWTPQYAKRVLAKMYKVDGAIRGRYCTMITLTSRQKDKSRLQQLQELNGFRCKIVDLLRHEVGRSSYFYVFEPHKTGYCHVHVLWFSRIPWSVQKRCKALWNKKYGAGGYSNALHFERSVKIENGRQYLMKYVCKTFVDEMPASGFLDFASCVSWSSRHDTAEKGVRLFGMSRDLSAICKAEKKTSSVFWVSYEISVYGDVLVSGTCNMNACGMDGEELADLISDAFCKEFYA